MKHNQSTYIKRMLFSEGERSLEGNLLISVIFFHTELCTTGNVNEREKEYKK